MNDRVPVPPNAAIVERLRNEEETSGTEPVMALVGFVGPGRDRRPGEFPPDVRLYPDLDLQRWMDFPREDLVDSRPLDPDETGDGGRTAVGGRHVVWVRQETMFRPVFKATSLVNFDEDFEDSAMSTWPLIPATRYVAAQLLDLVPGLSDDEGGQGGHP